MYSRVMTICHLDLIRPFTVRNEALGELLSIPRALEQCHTRGAAGERSRHIGDVETKEQEAGVRTSQM